MASTTVQVPGKLFLAGEYAVTKPGQPALLATVNQGLTIKIQPSASLLAGTLSIESTTIASSFDCSWSNLAKNYQSESTNFSGPWSFVQAALTLFSQEHPELFLSKQPGLKLTLTSQMTLDQQKLGLGSSAAVSVAIIKGLVDYFQLKEDLETIFKQAAFAHYFIQGSGSLGDLAAASYGQPIYYQAPAWIGQNQNWQLSDFKQLDWSQLEITPFSWPANWQLGIVATLEPASTKKALAKNFWSANFASQSKAAVYAIFQAIKDGNYHNLIRGLQANQNLLTATLPAGYLTKALANFLEIIQADGVAGKVSGAGYGDNGFVILQNADQGRIFKEKGGQAPLHLFLQN